MLNEFAKQAVSETPDWAAACDLVKQRIEAMDAAEREQLASEVLNAAVAVAVSRARHSIRTAFKAAADNPTQRMAILATAAGGVAAQTILETWIVGNARLGDCDAGMLGGAANQERTLADGHVSNARFYESLATKLLPGQRVRDAVTADRAMEVLESVRLKEQRAVAV